MYKTVQDYRASGMQPGLFDPVVDPDLIPDLRPTVSHNGDERPGSIDERFQVFHRENPHVYSGIVRLCRQMKRSGMSQWSTKAAFEVLRYQWQLHTRDTSGFKLSNDYTAPYARLIMDQEPDLRGFFVTKFRPSTGEDD